MIRWERVHPWFSVNFPRTEDVYVWEWRRPEGWIYWPEAVGQVTVPVFSGPAPAIALSVRERLQARPVAPPASLTEFLVIYSETNDRCSVGLVAARRSSEELQSCNEVPPAWWFIDKMTPMQVFLAQVQARLEQIRVDMAANVLLPKPPLRQRSTTHCGKCGLPILKHVAHDIPGHPRPSNAEGWAPYYKAFREHYGSALKKLTDVEVLGMEIPHSTIYLKFLVLEIQRRIDSPTPVKGRYDLILEDEPEPLL